MRVTGKAFLVRSEYALYAFYRWGFYFPGVIGGHLSDSVTVNQ